MILTEIPVTATPITFTVGQLIAILLGICGGIITISTAAAILIKAIHKIREPELKQNERIEALEKRVEEHSKFFGSDNKRLMELERGTTVTQQALLALLSHALNGNDEDSLREAKAKLESYLISRGGKINETG